MVKIWYKVWNKNKRENPMLDDSSTKLEENVWDFSWEKERLRLAMEYLGTFLHSDKLVE